MKKLMGETLNPRDIDEILRDGDLNGDGLVDFEGMQNKETQRSQFRTLFLNALVHSKMFMNCFLTLFLFSLLSEFVRMMSR